MVRLCFVGKDVIRRDPMAFLDGLRVQYPTVTEKGIQALALGALSARQPRHDQYVQMLFGRDILGVETAEQARETIGVWDLITPLEQGRILGTPLALREKLVDPAGLSRSYCWRKENDFIQEVTGDDVDIIRRSPAASWFQDADRYGAYTPVRAFDFPVIEHHETRSGREAKEIHQDLKRTRRWSGV